MSAPLGENVGRIERSVTASIIHDIAPYFQHPQPAQERFVNRTTGQLRQVVHITAQCSPSVARELLSTCLRLGDHRQRRQLHVVPAVHGQRHERQNLGCED
jgi:hypothetical protein